MCSVSGHDASGRVDDLVAQQNKQCTAIAIGNYDVTIERNFIWS
jgi:dynein heavy chain 1